MTTNLNETFAAVQVASRELALLNDDVINQILNAVADAAIAETPFILSENEKDLARMDKNDPKYDRLKLTEERLKGGLRNILPEGDITVGDVFEILPFENSLCVLTMKGTDLRRLCEAIASLHGEGVSGIRLEITKNGKLLNAFVGEKPLKDDQLYTVATIDYLADGNGRMDAFLQAEKRVCPEDATLRGLFLDYVRKQTAEGKAITSKLDGRISIK